MKLFRMLILVVALLAGGVAAYLALNLGPEAPAGPTVVELAPQIQSQDVLVAASDVTQGQKLTPENMRWQRWPEEALNPAYIQKQARPDAVEKLQGSIVRSQFTAGEPIRESKLARADSGFLSAILPSGKRAIAVRVSAQNTAGGFILPNDRVDVVQTITQQSGPDVAAQNVSRTILTNVKVLAIDQTVDEQPGGGGGGEGTEGAASTEGGAVVVGKTATLELDPAQVELITAAEASGTLSLSLRSFEDVGEVTAAIVQPVEVKPAETVVVTAPAPTPASPPERTSSVVKVYRNGRLQEYTVGAPPPPPPPVVAGDLPRYDSRAHCTEVARDGEDSREAFETCLQDEQSRLQELRAKWDSVPPEVRDRCGDAAKSGRTGSYALLSGCIDQEKTAARNTPDRRATI